MNDPEGPGSGAAPEPGDRSPRASPRAPRPVLLAHIGMHKTGSTSLQAFLVEHADRLSAAGWVYPRTGRHNDQHAVLPATAMPGHRVVPAELAATPREELLAALAVEVGTGRAALVSSEVFWELLTYRPEAFEDLVARLAQDWTVLLVFFARDAHGKSWSSVKHLGRVGPLADPVATYRDDLRLTQAAQARLLAAHPDAVRVAYDGQDSVGQLLDVLTDPRTTALAGTTAEQRAVLEELRRRRRHPGRRRINSDFRNPFGAAVSLCVAQHLGQVDPNDPQLERLTRVYHRLFRSPRRGWAGRGLPGDRELGQRIRRLAAADQVGVELLTEAERRAVLAGLTRHSARLLAATVRGRPALDLAAAAVRASLPGPVA